MPTALTKARSRTITPRDIALTIPAETPRYWMGGDPYSTHLMNTLSLMFPPGERFFMDAVRAFRAQLKDPQLIAQVRGFLGQEALHSREHRVFNRWLSRFGIDAERIDAADQRQHLAAPGRAHTDRRSGCDLCARALHGHHGRELARGRRDARAGCRAAARAVDLARDRGARSQVSGVRRLSRGGRRLRDASALDVAHQHRLHPRRQLLASSVHGPRRAAQATRSIWPAAGGATGDRAATSHA